MIRNHISAERAMDLICRKLSAFTIELHRENDRTLTAITPQKNALAIESLLLQDGSMTRFVLGEVLKSKSRFVVCTEVGEDGIPVQWVFPEMMFVGRGMTLGSGSAAVDLDEPGTGLYGATMRDGLCFLEERWDPIIQFDYFQEYMPAPEHPEYAERWLDMEDILELIWWREGGENRVSVGDWVPIAEIPDQEGRHKVRFGDEAADFIRQMPEEEGAELLNDLRSFLDGSREVDVLAVAGTRGNYRVAQPNRFGCG